MMKYAEPDKNMDWEIARQIILDTKNSIPSIEQSKDVIDLDLIGLGMSERFAKNGMLLKMEYFYERGKKDSTLNLDFEYAKARAKWIRTFLERKSIFVGFMKNTVFEINAKLHLKKELERCQIWRNV